MDCNFGKLFIAGFEGTKLSKELEEKLRELNPAGIILYDTNIESKEQVKELISSLKNLLGNNLIVTVDQEGGKVERLRKINTSLPSLQALGRASIKIGREQGLLFAREPLIDHSSILAEELSELGFSLVLAPCADLSTNPLNPIIGTRSLGSDPNIVSEQLKIIIQTYRDYGIKSCVKHFPGHGDTSIDSHLALPVQNYSLNEYLEHLKPFISAIDCGVESVMSAHLISKIDYDSKLEAAHYALDQDSIEDPKELGLKEMQVKQELPASISARVIQEELRRSLGFKGLVISDEITMKALAQYGSYPELAKKMLEAGNNLITWNTNLDDALQAAHYLNEQSREDSKLLYDAYYRSLELLGNYDWQSKTNIPITNKESKMLKIIENAIEWNKPVSEIRNMLREGATAVLVYDHPKLELDIIKNIFKLDSYKFTGKESSLEFLDTYTNLLILSFQTINNIDEDDFIIQLRNSQSLFEKLPDARHVSPENAELTKTSMSSSRDEHNDADGTLRIGSWNIIQCSCDMPDESAEVYLFGANKVHLEALLQGLG